MSVERRDKRGEVIPPIVICDDETRLATLTAGLLDDLGYKTSAFDLGSDALQVVSSSPAGCVLILDVNLRVGTSAQAVLGALDPKRVVVILTSGLGEDEVPEEIRRHVAVVDYLSKPYSVERLVTAVSLARSRLAAALAATETAAD